MADKNTPHSLPDSVTGQPAWLRLEDQLGWYDRESVCCQKRYKWLKLLQVVLAVGIPIASHLEPEVAKWVTSAAGAFIAILEAIQHMNQYSTLWITYRSTAERLKHEKFLFLSVAGPYKGLAEAERLIALAERVEEHVSTEHANCINEIKRIPARPNKEGH